MAPERPPSPLRPQRPAASLAPNRTKKGFEALPRGRQVLTGPELGMEAQLSCNDGYEVAFADGG